MDIAVQVTCDYRERPSGVPELLRREGCRVDFARLYAGDYMVNRQLVVERKTATDFVHSLISKRLFQQCTLLVKSRFRPLILLESNPYITNSDISFEAVRGAFVSVSTAWHIPVIQTKDALDTAKTIRIIGKQQLVTRPIAAPPMAKSRNTGTKVIQFLQGLPNVGPVLAQRLVDHFGSLYAVFEADLNDLQRIPGLGSSKALAIQHFLGKSIP